MVMPDLLPLFLNLSGRRVLLVGGGAVALAKLRTLVAAAADVRVVAPVVHDDIIALCAAPASGQVTSASGQVMIARREFHEQDLDDVWLVVAAATPAVNRAVAVAAEHRRVFVNAVDDPANASAFLSGVIRRDGLTLAISTHGEAPGLTALLREALDAVLPRDLAAWLDEARRQRAGWRRDGTPMEARRPLLLEALNALYRRRTPTTSDVVPEGAPVEDDRAASHPPGKGPSRERSKARVSIVGAGPGDPGLLTRKAVARLRAADLVLYDALVDDRVLALARRAQRFFVGKRAGRHALSQPAIHALMIRAARRGRHVVRLKGGDPFVYGRGGEEALALQQAGIPFDIVPGVSSLLAGPALAGIPITHRGLAASVLVTTGHDVEAFGRTVRGLATNEVREGLTLIVAMGFGRRVALSACLLGAGWQADTPAAIVAGSSLPTEQVWRGSLGGIVRGEDSITGDDPAVLLVGEVAGLDLRAIDLKAVADSTAADVASSNVQDEPAARALRMPVTT